MRVLPSYSDSEVPIGHVRSRQDVPVQRHTDLQRAEDERRQATIEGGDHILQDAVHTKAVASAENARVAMTERRKEHVAKRTLELTS